MVWTSQNICFRLEKKNFQKTKFCGLPKIRICFSQADFFCSWHFSRIQHVSSLCLVWRVWIFEMRVGPINLNTLYPNSWWKSACLPMFPVLNLMLLNQTIFTWCCLFGLSVTHLLTSKPQSRQPDERNTLLSSVLSIATGNWKGRSFLFSLHACSVLSSYQITLWNTLQRSSWHEGLGPNETRRNRSEIPPSNWCSFSLQHWRRPKRPGEQWLAPFYV